MQSLIGVSARLLYGQRGATSRIAGGGQDDRRFKVIMRGRLTNKERGSAPQQQQPNQDGWPALTNVTLRRL